MQVEIFDAVWATVPPIDPHRGDAGRGARGWAQRAVADSRCASPRARSRGEPSMASRLPTRWTIDKRLPDAAYPAPSSAWVSCRRPCGLAGVAKTGPSSCSRGGSGVQRGRGPGHRRARGPAAGAGALLREAERRRDGAPGIDRSGRGAGHGARRHRVRGRAAAARRGARPGVAGRRAARAGAASDRARASRSRCSRTGCGTMPRGGAEAGRGGGRLIHANRPWSRLGAALIARAAPRRVRVGREHAVGQPAGQGTSAGGDGWPGLECVARVVIGPGPFIG